MLSLYILFSLYCQSLNGEWRGTGIVIAEYQALVVEGNQMSLSVVLAIGVHRAKRQVLGLDDLVHQAIAVDGQHMAVVGQGDDDRLELCGVVVTAGAGAVECPVVAGEQAVLAFVDGAVDAQLGTLVGGVDAVDQSAVTLSIVVDGEERAFVFVSIEFEGHRHSLTRFQADAVGAWTFIFVSLGCQLLLPVEVAEDAGGEALRVILIHHPVVIVALHPSETEGGGLSAGDDKGARIVLWRVHGQLLRTADLALVVDGVAPQLVDAVLVVLSVLGGDAEVHIINIRRVNAHAAAVAPLCLIPVLMEGMAGILHPSVLPRRSVPAGIPIDMRSLVVVNVRIGNDGMLLLVQGYLPHPVADVGRAVDDGSGVLVGIAVGLADVEHAIADDGKLLAVEVAQNGTIAIVDVNDIEVEPVRLLVVGMTGGVAHIDFILAVALIFGVWACAC